MEDTHPVLLDMEGTPEDGEGKAVEEEYVK